MLISIIGLAVLLGSLFLGLPIAWGMLLVGTLGFAFFTGMEAALTMGTDQLRHSHELQLYRAAAVHFDG